MEMGPNRIILNWRYFFLRSQKMARQGGRDDGLFLLDVREPDEFKDWNIEDIVTSL